MANENLPSGRGYLLVKSEGASYATDPTAAVANVIYVEDFEWDMDDDDIPRTGPSPGHPQGFLSDVGARHLSFSFSCPILPREISAADDTDAPNIDAILRGSGLVRTSVASTTDTHAYVSNPDASGSYWMEFYSLDEDNADGNKVVFPGCRSSIELSFEGGARATASVSGLAVATAAAGVAAIGAGAGAVVYQSEAALIARAAVVKVVDLSDDSLYGGGSLASPGNAVLVRSLSVDLAMAPTERTGLSPLYGVGAIKLAPAGPIVAQMVAEAVAVGDFDPWALRRDRQPIEVNIKFPAPAGVTTTTTVLYYGQIVEGIDQSDDGGVRTWGLTQHTRYPEVAVGGSPAVGVAPTQVMTAGTNQGLPLAIAGLTSGVFALIFTTPQ